MPFQVEVKSSSAVVSGVYEADFKQGALILTQSGAEQIIVPAGTPSTADDASNFLVRVKDQDLTLRVLGVLVYTVELAAAASAHLSGKGPEPREDDFSVPIWLVALCFFPAAIPVMTLGGAIPAGIGCGLVGANFGIAKNAKMDLGIRVVTILGLSVAGFVATFAILYYLGAFRPRQ